MTALDAARARAQDLAKKAAQAKAKAQKLEQKIKSLEAGKARAIETRQKILLGAYLLAQAKKTGSGYDFSRMTFGEVTLDSYLVRDDDRQIFGLPPRSEAA